MSAQNTKNMPTFTYTQGLYVQKIQLMEWKSILKHDVYRRLEGEAIMRNFDTAMQNGDGYNVWRGTDMNNWIFNNLMVKS